MLAGLTALCAAGCGKSDDTGASRSGSAAGEDADEEAEEEEEDDEADADGKQEADAEDADIAGKLCGKWNFVCANEGFAGADPEDWYFHMAEDDGGIRKEIEFYLDEGILYADYQMQEYEWSNTCYHLPVTIEEGALYETCDNTEWYATVRHPDLESLKISVTLTDDDEMMSYERYDTEYEDGTSTYLVFTTFVKEGSEAEEHASDFRYDRIVEVSTAEELIAAIGDHTKILLNEGDYNLSGIANRTDTRKVWFDPWGFGTDHIVIHNVNCLCIAAKDGADVTISTDAPDQPVLQFNDSKYVFLDGIKCVHNVPAGGCTGSVIYTDGVYDLRISNCNLNGSGTYGLECDNTTLIRCTDSEIEHCTNGIMWLSECYSASFDNCDMHDNVSSSMIMLYNSCDVWFADCEFSNNVIDEGSYASTFVAPIAESSNIGFRRCMFRDNVYPDFSNGAEIFLEDCKFSDQ